MSIPLVLHGGTGIGRDSIHEAISHGLAKINIGTGIRQLFEALMEKSISTAQKAVYEAARTLLLVEFNLTGTASLLKAQSGT